MTIALDNKTYERLVEALSNPAPDINGETLDHIKISLCEIADIVPERVLENAQ